MCVCACAPGAAVQCSEVQCGAVVAVVAVRCDASENMSGERVTLQFIFAMLKNKILFIFWRGV